MFKKGFTLIELLVVALIISILVTIVSVNYSQYKKSSRDTKGIEEIEAIAKALELKYAESMQYPDLPDSPSEILQGDKRLSPYLEVVPNSNGTSNYYWLDGGSTEKYCVYFKLEKVKDTYFTCSQAGCQKCQTTEFSPETCCRNF